MAEKQNILGVAFGAGAPAMGATPAPSPVASQHEGFDVELPPLPPRRRERGRRKLDMYVDVALYAEYQELLRKAKVQFDCKPGEFQDAVLSVAMASPAEIARTLREALFEVEDQ